MHLGLVHCRQRMASVVAPSAVRLWLTSSKFVRRRSASCSGMCCRWILTRSFLPVAAVVGRDQELVADRPKLGFQNDQLPAACSQDRNVCGDFPEPTKLSAAFAIDKYGVKKAVD